MGQEVLLQMTDICKEFPGVKALDHVSLTVKKGTVHALMGENGAGKSTMLNAVAGVWPVDDGRIILDGVDVTAMPEYRRAQYIGRVFQDPMMGTAANMQIEENLALAARRGKKRTLRWGVTKAEREEYHEKLKSFGLGLEDRMTAKVGLLSGGQRQALTLLMASLQKPKLLLLDEPAAGMNPNETKELMETIHFVRDEFDMTILLIEHDMKLVGGICEELTVLNFGRVLCQGKTSDVLNNPEVIKAYLGE